MAMKGNAASGGLLERNVGDLSPLADNLFRFFVRAAIVLASCYAAFVAYLAMMNTETWLEKLRLLPLLILALTVPMLGAAMIRKKYQMELQS